MSGGRAHRSVAWLLAAAVAALPLAAAAQAVPIPPMTATEVSAQLEGNATLESRLDVDFDFDGELDTVFVALGSRGRMAIAMQAYRDAGGEGHRRIGVLRLPDSPLMPAQLALRSGVLSIDDLTGSDTATQATYRFRYDRKLRTLRLVGLDAARYSRRRLHGSVRLNWDPVSGLQALSFGTPTGGEGSEQGYRYGDVRRKLRKAPALTFGRTPTADQALEQAGVRLGQGMPVGD